MSHRIAPYAGVFAAAALAACAHVAAKAPPPTIALVEAARGSGYEPLNAPARRGLDACARETGAAIETSASEDAEQQLALFATENADTIIGIGPQMVPAMAALARRFEARHFVMIGATVPEPNVESVVFNEDDGAFLAGALAAMVSKTNRVAFLGGPSNEPQRQAARAFAAGAAAVNPRATVRASYLGESDDRAAADRLAAQLFQTKADVVYVAAGDAGLGAFDAVRGRRAAYLIGSGNDRAALAPGKVLASVVDRVDAAVLRACLETVAQKPASGIVELGVAQGGVSLAGLQVARSVAGEPAIRRLEALAQEISAGRSTSQVR